MRVWPVGGDISVTYIYVQSSKARVGIIRVQQNPENVIPPRWRRLIVLGCISPRGGPED